MAAEGKSKRKRSPRGFYGRALDEAEQVQLAEASHMEGIDEEIALLRVKLRELLAEQPERIDRHFEAANVIARLVRTRYQITREQKKSLKEAIQKVLAEVAVPLGVGVGVGLARANKSNQQVVAQFVGRPPCHCEADEVSRSNPVRGMRLPRTFQVLAMTKSEGRDKSGNYIFTCSGGA